MLGFRAFATFLTCVVCTTVSAAPITSTWQDDGGNFNGNWSETVHWDILGGGDLFPDNGANNYTVILPSAGSAYTVNADTASLVMDSLSIDGDAQLILLSTDFDPGVLTNNGAVEIQVDELLLGQSLTNNGTIRFDTDTGSESIRLTSGVTFSGTGSLLYPDIATTSPGVHRLSFFNGQPLVNDAGHTIEGGPGQIQYSSNAFFAQGFTNDGEVRANVSGKILEINGLSDDLELVNNNLLRAESGGILEFDDLVELVNNGTVSCDASSTINITDMSTDLSGTVIIDGLMRIFSNGFVTFDAASGAGTGELRVESFAVTYDTGTTVEFGTVNVIGSQINVNAGANVTVRDLYTHALTTETSHTIHPTSGVRIIGGTAAGPLDFDDFAAIEIAGEDMGNIAAGFTDNFEIPNLIIGPGAKVNLFDVINNGNRDGSSGTAEALYVDTLEFEDPLGLLNTNGHNIYFNTLVGAPAQIVDSGGGSGKEVATSWTCTSDDWSDSACWSTLAGSDTFPNNDIDTAYVTTLPDNGGLPFTVNVDVGPITLRSLNVDDDAFVVLNATDFDPGLLTNDGTVEIQVDELLLGQSINNNGTIQFDTDTGGESLRLLAGTTFDGTGRLFYPDIATTSTSTHRIFMSIDQPLTNGANHTIEGGPGQIVYAINQFFPNGFTNDGIFRANTPGKSLEINGSSDDLEVINNNLMSAENGATLELDNLAELVNNGTLSCDATSTILMTSMSTDIAGTVSVDGLFRITNNSFLIFDGASGSGSGELFIESFGLTYDTGTTVEFGTVNITAGQLTVNAGVNIVATDLFTHALTIESTHSFHPTSGVRMTGGTAAGPTDFDDFAAIEIAGEDMGDIPAGFTDNFEIPNLIIGTGAKVNLFDVINNGNRNGSVGPAEALYVDTLQFEDATGLLNTNGHNIYFNTLIGDPGQIVDSGGGSGKAVASLWICGTDLWSDTACWDTLAPGDSFPDNSLDIAYDVTLPTNGSYTVSTDASNVEVRSLNVDANATVAVTSFDFNPGALTNEGLVQLEQDELLLGQAIINNGDIQFDLDTGGETIRLVAGTAFNGTGRLFYPDIGTTSTSTHRIFMSNDQPLVNGPNHTMEGGPGQIVYAINQFFPNGFTNNGIFRANTPGKTLEINGSSDDLEVINNNLMAAENGATLELDNLAELINNGTLSCDTTSTILINNMSTDLTGTLNIDGLLRMFSSSFVSFSGTDGGGDGELRVETGAVVFNSGTSVEFGTVNVQAATITVNSGGTVTVRDAYTHSITSETSHNFNGTAALRVVGTDCNPPTTIETAGSDQGDIPAGFMNNFQLSRLIVGPGAIAQLVDDNDNGNRNGPNGAAEALYVDTIEFEDGAGRLILNGLNLYFNTLVGDPNQIGLGVDCNGNAQPDECDTALATSPDCNGDFVPDECEIDQASGAPGGPFFCMMDCDPDCNDNGIPDACDIADVTSTDLNNNDIPDECEDCNNNTIPDALDIINGTSLDCNGNGTPDECIEDTIDVFTWIGPDGASFTADANWSPAQVPGGDAVLSNAGASDNTAVLSAPGETTVCSLSVDATGSGDQILRIDAGATLNPTSGMTIGTGGEIDLNGGTLTGGTVNNNSTSITGSGTVDADVVNIGRIEADAGGTITLTGNSFDNQATGQLNAPAASLILVQSPTVTQSGSIDISTLAGVIFSTSLTNQSGGQINLADGSLSADGVTNDAGALIDGFGTIDSDLNNDGDVNIVADAQVVGNVVNEGSITVQSGLLTIIGSLSGGGTIIGDFSSMMMATGSGVAVIGNANLSDAATLTVDSGILRVSGNVDVAINDFNRFDVTAGTIQMVGLPGSPQTLEMLSEDVGNNVELPDASLFSIDQLRVGPTSSETALVDTHDNTAGPGKEVLYVNDLILEPGVTLDLAGCVIYYDTVTPADPFDAGSGVTVIDSSVDNSGDLIQIVTGQPCDTDCDCYVDAVAMALPIDVCDYTYCDNNICTACTRRYGNTCPSFGGVVQTSDILCAVAGFGNYCSCPNADLFDSNAPGCTAMNPENCKGPSGIPIGTNDILAVVNAFGGANPFGCVAGTGCDNAPPPSASGCSVAAATTIAMAAPTTSTGEFNETNVMRSPSNHVEATTLHIVPRKRTARPGDTVTVDVFVSNVAGLKAFEFGLSTSANDNEKIKLCDINVETQRRDHVFNGLINFPATDKELGRIGGVAMDAGVTIGQNDRAYLGTFTFDVASDARGAINLQAVTEFTALYTNTENQTINPVDDAFILVTEISRGR